MNDPDTCENCGKSDVALVTRTGFKISFYVEWVCVECFEELEGVSFSAYKHPQSTAD